ncbi:hypothetical protein NE865_03063 [Phthorimaea operculella]|nr:hypothetical protein NE865_03063 [Phthorimaea operculella]
MCDANDKLTAAHSCYSTSFTHSKKALFDIACKSDMNISSELNNPAGQNGSYKALSDACGEYYKKYDHDEIPVKDLVISNELIGTGDSEKITAITNSLLDQLEHRRGLKKYESQELQTEGSSIESLESHIKFFRTTVQEIFDTFYTNMRDYEGYKKRYNDILKKSKADTLDEMEEFIKDVIQHIVSAEPSNTSIASIRTNLTYDIKDAGVKTNVPFNKFSTIESFESVFEYKNQNYESMNSGESSEKKQSVQSGDVLNIYFVSNSPSVEIKFNDRNLFSETNVKDRKPTIDSKIASSADNLKREALKEHEEEIKDAEDTDREIPIKSSLPKKNIHLNEDFHDEHEKDERSMISKFCSYLCKKFRKSV